MQGERAGEQATVGRWAWQNYAVLVRPMALPWPPGVDALTLRDGSPGIRARIWYRADNPHWRAAVMRELAALVGESAA